MKSPLVHTIEVVTRGLFTLQSNEDELTLRPRHRGKPIIGGDEVKDEDPSSHETC